jgi:TPR repeat protein
MKGIERLEEIIVNGTKLQRSAAAYQLYWNIRDGKGASADKRRSMKYLRVAAENGSVDAMYQMGWHYGTGTFVGKNIVKAIDWYRKAADKGDAWAQVDLGQIYLDGERSVDKDYIQAVRLFRKAARKSDELAFYDLGLCYDLGKGVRQSDRLACKFYSKAALRGHVAAMCNLGAILANYDGSQRDGILWTRRAALRGDDKAQHNLGEWYANGECGLKKSRRLALKWLKMSAGNGNKKAAKSLARLTALQLKAPTHKSCQSC